MIKDLLRKMSNVDQELTQAELNDLNALQQAILACKSAMSQYERQASAELLAIPRPQVLQSAIAQARAYRYSFRHREPRE